MSLSDMPYLPLDRINDGRPSTHCGPKTNTKWVGVLLQQQMRASTLVDQLGKGRFGGVAVFGEAELQRQG